MSHFPFLPPSCRISGLVYVYAWSDDAGAEWSRDSDATICNVSSPSAQCAQAQARITDRCSAPPPDTVFPDTSLTAAVASQGMVTGNWPGHQDHTLHVSSCGDMSSCQHSGSFDLHIGRYMVLLLSKDFPT